MSLAMKPEPLAAAPQHQHFTIVVSKNKVKTLLCWWLI